MDEPRDIGEISIIFDSMRINHPRIKEVTSKFNSARRTKRDAPYLPKRYVEFFAESHTGKTTAVLSYLENVVVPEVIAEGLFPADMPKEKIAREQCKALFVPLHEKATRKSLYSDILRRLGDGRANHGTIADLRDRAYSYLSDKKVELLILDEIQHLSAGILKEVEGRKSKEFRSQGTDVSDALKMMLIEGLVPIAFVGVPAARVHFAYDEQLPNRELCKIDFAPIRWTVEEERDLFANYCIELGVLIEDKGLMPEISDFASNNIPACLWAASSGRIGLASRLCEQAVLHASQRGARKVEYQDLERAVDTRGIPNNYCLYNPFTLGVRDLGDEAA